MPDAHRQGRRGTRRPRRGVKAERAYWTKVQYRPSNDGRYAFAVASALTMRSVRLSPSRNCAERAARASRLVIEFRLEQSQGSPVGHSPRSRFLLRLASRVMVRTPPKGLWAGD